MLVILELITALARPVGEILLDSALLFIGGDGDSELGVDSGELLIGESVGWWL